MTTKDKVAIILSRYGFSLEEGMGMYCRLMASGKKYVINIDMDKDCAVWLEREWADDDENTVHVMVWRNYRNDFCLNYTLAGAVALGDADLNLDEGDTAKFMAFFRQCQKADGKDEEIPGLADDMKWIFTCAVLEDYMEADNYDVDDSTELELRNIL